jgi:hypothetical protein
MNAQVNFGSRLWDLLTEPAKAFGELESARVRSLLLPVFVQILASVLLFYLYYNNVDFSWYLSQLASKVPPEQQEGLTKSLTPTVMSISTGVMLFISVPVVLGVSALYLYLIGKVRNLEHSFGQWFLLVAWASMPVILTLPVGAGALFGGDGRILPEDLNPLSLAQLLGVEADSPWRALLSSVTLLLLWTLYLMATGYRRWAKVSSVQAGLVIAAPYLVIFGTWALLVLAASAA